MKRNKLSAAFAIMILSVLCFADLRGETGRAVVTGDRLRVRSAPGLKGTILNVLNTGDPVTVLETGKVEKIGDMEKRWYKIQSGKITGWVYGAFLSFDCKIKADGSVVAWNSCVDEYCEQQVLHIKRKGNSIIKIEYWGPSTGYEFSQSFNYVAVDSGTDIVRSIYIYDTRSGGEVHNASHMGSALSWNGDTMIIEQIDYTGDCCVTWEEQIFENGVVRKGSRTGWGEFHCSGTPDDFCRKIMGRKGQ